VSDYELDNWGSILGRGKGIFPLSCVQTGSGAPTQLPVQWVLGILSLGVKRGRGVTLTTHPHPEVVNEFELYLLSPKVPPWCVTGLLYYFCCADH
jgi:hypothetical protein